MIYFPLIRHGLHRNKKKGGEIHTVPPNKNRVIHREIVRQHSDVIGINNSGGDIQTDRQTDTKVIS
jgi:hypothetical protein